MVGQAVGVGGLGQLGLGGVPVAGHQQRLGQVPDRDREQVAGAGPAQLGGGGAGRLGAGGGVGAGHRVGQVEQRAAQQDSVAGLPGQPGGLPEVGGRLRPAPGEGVADPAGGEQAGEGGVVHGQVLAQGQGLGGQRVRGG